MSGSAFQCIQIREIDKAGHITPDLNLRTDSLIHIIHIPYPIIIYLQPLVHSHVYLPLVKHVKYVTNRHSYWDDNTFSFMLLISRICQQVNATNQTNHRNNHIQGSNQNIFSLLSFNEWVSCPMSPTYLIRYNSVHVDTAWTPALVEGVHPVDETILVDSAGQQGTLTGQHEGRHLQLVTQPTWQPVLNSS